MILTDEQIAERAEKYADSVPDNDNDSLYSSDIRAYENGWKECTEHYRELIEAGMKWKELKERIEKTLSNYSVEELNNKYTKTEMFCEVADQVRMMTKYEINW